MTAVVACFRKRDESLEAELLNGPVEFRYLPAGSVLGWMRRLRELLRTEPFDLVHTTLFEADIAGRLAARGLRLPVLTSLVNTSYERIRLSDPNVTRFGLWSTRVLDGWTARHLTTHFHAITHAVKESSVRALRISPDKVTVIERGRDASRLGKASVERRLRSRSALGLSQDEDVVVCVGRQEFQKGHRYLIEAFREVARQHPQARLLLVGRSGHASPALETLCRQFELMEQVRFLGYREDIPDILAAADLFAFPSLYEGQGGALVEAMALGLPVVATDIPSTREVVEENKNALLAEPASASGLASSILTMLSDRALMSAFGRHSATIYQNRFTIEHSARRMMSLYRDLMNSKVA